MLVSPTPWNTNPYLRRLVAAREGLARHGLATLSAQGAAPDRLIAASCTQSRLARSCLDTRGKQFTDGKLPCPVRVLHSELQPKRWTFNLLAGTGPGMAWPSLAAHHTQRAAWPIKTPTSCNRYPSLKGACSHCVQW